MKYTDLYVCEPFTQGIVLYGTFLLVYCLHKEEYPNSIFNIFDLDGLFDVSQFALSLKISLKFL